MSSRVPLGVGPPLSVPQLLAPTMIDGTSYDVFLSYHWRDRAQVEAIAHALREHRVRVFLDRWYLRPGRPWPQELQAAMAGCRAAAIFIGPGEMGPWQQREVYLALERQAAQPSFVVIPILLPGAEPVLGFLGQYTWLDLRDQPQDPALMAMLAAAILDGAPGQAVRERIQQTVAAISPYRGLLYFREEDAPFFFGRDAAIHELVEAVGQRSFVALVGASGSGKSSVVRAGLVPALRRSQDQVWEIVTLVPGDRPLRSLAAALLQRLEPDLSEVDRLLHIGTLETALRSGELGLRDVVEQLLSRQPGTDRLLLVVDQWEELYTLTADDTTRRRFMDELLAACQRAPLSIVLTLRGDFVGHALAYRPISDRLQGAQVNLGPMTRAELALAIERPAERVGITFEPGLVERILDDAGDEPGNLPLLEFVLKQLWENRRHDQLLHEVYETMGHLQGAVAKKADQIFGRFSRDEQQAVQRIFLQLATPAEEGAYVRRRASLAEISHESKQLLRRLTDERLLVTSPGAEVGEVTVEVSHEALISNWDQLRSWLDQDREFLLWRRRFNEFMRAWRQDRSRVDTLLTGAFLAEADKWLRERGDRLTTEEGYYIAASKAHHRRQTQKARRRTRAFVSAVGLFGVLALGFALDSQRQQRRAQTEATTAFALQLAAQARQKVDANLVEALLLGVAAVDLLPIHETEDNLLRLLRSIPSGLQGFQWGHRGPLWSVAFSPDGKLLATGSRDRTVILWEVASRTPLGAPLAGHTGDVWSVAFSPDGTMLATGSSDGTVILWDLASRRPRGEPLDAGSGAVWSVAFSPDGRTLATGNADGTVVLWDVASRAPLGEPLRGHTDEVWSVGFDPSGTLIASGGNDHRVILWDVASRRPLGEPLEEHTAEVWSVAFSPDGKLLATGGDDETVILWDVASRKPLGEPLRGHRSEVWSLAFSADGKTLATASWDQTVVLWDVESRKPMREPLRAHRAPVTSVAFSADGQTLATGSWDRTAILWEVAGTTPVGEPVEGHSGEVLSVAFSADGRMLATGSDDETVVVWDVASRRPLGEPLRGHTDEIWTVAFSPDGNMLASGSRDRTVILWDLATYEPIGEPLRGHEDEVLSVAFNPTGTLLASGGDDGTVILWDMGSRTPLGDPLERPEGEVWSVAFSPDGRTLAGGWDRRVILWDLASRKMLGEPLTGHTDVVSRVVFSQDGKTLASASRDKTVLLWGTASRKALGEPLQRQVEELSSIAFSVDGDTLTTLSKDGMVVQWDVRNRRMIGEPLLGGLSEISSAAIAPDGKTFATGGRDGTVILAQANHEVRSWKPQVCRILNRNFTQVEWGRYMGERPYRKVCPDAPMPESPEE